MNMNEISLRELEGVYFGNAQDDLGKTGVTVAIFPKGARCGVDISPTTAPTPINAIVFAGGSI